MAIVNHLSTSSSFFYNRMATRCKSEFIASHVLELASDSSHEYLEQVTWVRGDTVCKVIITLCCKFTSSKSASRVRKVWNRSTLHLKNCRHHLEEKRSHLVAEKGNPHDQSIKHDTILKETQPNRLEVRSKKSLFSRRRRIEIYLKVLGEFWPILNT